MAFACCISARAQEQVATAGTSDAAKIPIVATYTWPHGAALSTAATKAEFWSYSYCPMDAYSGTARMDGVSVPGFTSNGIAAGVTGAECNQAGIESAASFAQHCPDHEALAAGGAPALMSGECILFAACDRAKHQYMTDVQQGCVIHAMVAPQQGPGYGAMTDQDPSTWSQSTLAYTSTGDADASGVFHTAFMLDNNHSAEPLCGVRWYGIPHEVGDYSLAATSNPDITIQYTRSTNLTGTAHGDLAGMDTADWRNVAIVEKELGVDPRTRYTHGSAWEGRCDPEALCSGSSETGESCEQANTVVSSLPRDDGFLAAAEAACPSGCTFSVENDFQICSLDGSRPLYSPDNYAGGAWHGVRFECVARATGVAFKWTTRHVRGRSVHLNLGEVEAIAEPLPCAEWPPTKPLPRGHPLLQVPIAGVNASACAAVLAGEACDVTCAAGFVDVAAETTTSGQLYCPLLNSNPSTALVLRPHSQLPVCRALQPCAALSYAPPTADDSGFVATGSGARRRLTTQAGDGLQYDVSGCSTVAAGASCLVSCSSAYYGSSVRFDCPGDNIDRATQPFGAWPVCTPRSGCVALPDLGPRFDETDCAGVAAGDTCEVGCAENYAGTSVLYHCPAASDAPPDALADLLPSCEPIVPCAPLEDLGDAYDVSDCSSVDARRECSVMCAQGYRGSGSFYICPVRKKLHSLSPSLSQ